MFCWVHQSKYAFSQSRKNISGLTRWAILIEFPLHVGHCQCYRLKESPSDISLGCENVVPHPPCSGALKVSWPAPRLWATADTDVVCQTSWKWWIELVTFLSQGWNAHISFPQPLPLPVGSVFRAPQDVEQSPDFQKALTILSFSPSCVLVLPSVLWHWQLTFILQWMNKCFKWAVCNVEIWEMYFYNMWTLGFFGGGRGVFHSSFVVNSLIYFHQTPVTSPVTRLLSFYFCFVYFFY